MGKIYVPLYFRTMELLYKACSSPNANPSFILCEWLGIWIKAFVRQPLMGLLEMKSTLPGSPGQHSFGHLGRLACWPGEASSECNRTCPSMTHPESWAWFPPIDGLPLEPAAFWKLLSAHSRCFIGMKCNVGSNQRSGLKVLLKLIDKSAIS